MTLKALELFCGIGGFSAAVGGMNVTVTAAFDRDRDALAVYRRNFPGNAARTTDLEKITTAELAEIGADFWWLSPPCQPYCVRGFRRDLSDPRARSLIRLMEILRDFPKEKLPACLGLENVTGFEQSEAGKRLLDILAGRGYHIIERRICPTDLGVPSRRPRYYLAASLSPINPPSTPGVRYATSLSDYLDTFPPDQTPEELLVPDHIISRFGNGLRILDPDDPRAYTTCFTSGYGRSIMHAGSYLRHGTGVRRFSPVEIARLLHFPSDFRFPDGMSARTGWRLAGNSLSVVAVREVLRAFPAISSS